MKIDKQRSIPRRLRSKKALGLSFELKRPDGDGHLRRLRKDLLDLQRSHLAEIAQEEALQRLQDQGARTLTLWHSEAPIRKCGPSSSARDLWASGEQ